MKPMFHTVLRLAVFLGLLVVAGCKTDDSDLSSERPWNAPKGWETGLPSGLTEGR